MLPGPATLVHTCSKTAWDADDGGRWSVRTPSCRSCSRSPPTRDGRDAVAEGQLTLHYQPKLDLGRGRITGVEALVRWPQPVHGLIPPGEFVPLAEQTGVIEPLNDLVVERAQAQAAAWRARGIDLTMAVNVSATNLLRDGWTATVLAALAETGVRPDRFAIEITEDVLLTDPDRALLAPAELSTAGVRVALD